MSTKPTLYVAFGLALAGCIADEGADRSGEPSPEAGVDLDESSSGSEPGVAFLPAPGAEGETTTTWEYFPNGQLRSQTVDGVETSYTYNSDGTVATATRPGGVVTTYSNYRRGVAQREDHPEGVVIQRVVDDLGNITSETDGEQHTTTYVYDELGRLRRVNYPIASSNPTIISYYQSGASVQVDRGNYIENQVFDGFGRQTSRSTTTTVTTRYDGLGRKTFVSNPGATAGTTFTYDYLGRVTEMRNADNSTVTFTYRASAGGTPVVDLRNERGFVTTQWFREVGGSDDEMMRIDAPVADASVQMTRNVRGQVTSAVQAGVERRWGYDSRYYLTSVTNPETGVTTIGRDAAGNMTSFQVGSSGTTYFDLDGLLRVKDVRYPNSADNVHQEWDRNGRLRLTSNATSTRTWVYDANGNRKEDKLVVGGQTFTTTYNFNTRDNLLNVTYPLTGTIVSFSPDRDGRPTKVGTYASEIVLSPTGRPLSLKHPNKTSLWVTLDARMQPRTSRVEYRNMLADTFFTYVDQTYGFDLAGNLTTVTDAQNAVQERTYGYDGLDRLTSVAIPGSGTSAITYDGVGNMRQYGGLTYTYDAATNRLASTSGTLASQFAYDTRGNVTSNGTLAFQYDDSSRLRCAQCGTSQEVRYGYDGTGARVSRTGGGVTTYEIRDQSGNLLLDVDPATGRRQEHFYLGSQRIATNGLQDPALGKIVYFHNDLAGSPIAATDAAGTLLWKESYQPYGERITKPAAAAANKIWFHGKPVDPVTGLADFGARNYDARLGRFLSIDPEDFSDQNVHSFNRYAYGNNNPLKYRDLDGRVGQFFIGGEAMLWLGSRIMCTRYGPAILGAVSSWGAAEFGYGVSRFPARFGTNLPITTSVNKYGEHIAEVVGDADAYAGVIRTASGIRAWGLYRGAQPEGTGTQLLVRAIRSAGGLRSGQTLKLDNIIEARTVEAFKAGVEAAQSKLGRTAARALNELGLIGKNFRWEVEDVVEVGRTLPTKQLNLLVEID